MDEPSPTVEPINGEPMRYRVRSDSARSQPHMVDLSEYGGNGQCSCKDYQCRREPNIKKGAPPFSALTLCKHIKAARTYFLNGTLAAISEQLHPNEPTRQTQKTK